MRAILGCGLAVVLAVTAGVSADDKAEKVDGKKLIGKWEPKPDVGVTGRARPKAEVLSPEGTSDSSPGRKPWAGLALHRMAWLPGLTPWATICRLFEASSPTGYAHPGVRVRPGHRIRVVRVVLTKRDLDHFRPDETGGPLRGLVTRGWQ
jgi:hypothetical protein